VPITVDATPTAPTEDLVTPTRVRRAGLLVLGLLSLSDLTSVALTDGTTPPWPVAIADAVLGAASLVLVFLAWRGRAGVIWPLVGLRALSAITAVPAFFVGAGVALVVLAAAIVVLTVAGVLLVAGRPEQVSRA
jgi:hypothetical protein